MKTSCPGCGQHIEIPADVMATLAGQQSFDCPACEAEVPVPRIARLVAEPMDQTPVGSVAGNSPPSVTAKSLFMINRRLLVLGTTVLLVIGTVTFLLVHQDAGNTYNVTVNRHDLEIQNEFFTNLINSGVTTNSDLEAVTKIRPYGTLFIGVSKTKVTLDQALDLARRTGAHVLKMQDNDSAPWESLSKWLLTQYAAQLNPAAWIQHFGDYYGFTASGEFREEDPHKSQVVFLQWQGTGKPSPATEADQENTPVENVANVAEDDVAEKTWTNHLGMRFIPLPSNPSKLMGVEEVRVKDFSAFVKETGYNQWTAGRDNPQGLNESYPTVGVSFDGAQRFATWLTEREKSQGGIRNGDTYFVPTRKDLSELLDNAAGPEGAKSSATGPLDGAGSNTEMANLVPVGSFPPVGAGFHDLIGNAAEWTSSWTLDGINPRELTYYQGFHLRGVMQNRGSGFPRFDAKNTTSRQSDLGFRVMLDLQTASGAQLAKRLEAALDSVRAVNNLPGPLNSVSSIKDGLITLNLKSRAHVPDLSALAGLPIESLEIYGTGVTDLSFLKSMPLDHLGIGFTPVRDLGPLRGLPLRQLDLQKMHGDVDRDLEPLTGCPLEYVNVVPTAVNLTALNRIPTLKHIDLYMGTILRLPIKAILNGEQDAALLLLEEFEREFRDHSLFEKHVEEVSRVVSLRRWVCNGRKGPPPGTKEGRTGWRSQFEIWRYDGSNSQGGTWWRFNQPQREALARFLGGRLLSPAESPGSLAVEWGHECSITTMDGRGFRGVILKADRETIEFNQVSDGGLVTLRINDLSDASRTLVDEWRVITQKGGPQ